MLNITFEARPDDEAQARGVVAALVAIYGPSVLPTQQAVFQAYADKLNAETPERAADGYPSTGSIEIKEFVDVSDKFDPDYEKTKRDGWNEAINEPANARDTDGILWDERIHTSNKSTKQDGTWKRKPGLDDAYFTQVMAELKAANTARTLEAAAPLVPTPPTAPTAQEAFTPPASVVIPAHVPAPPVPAVPTPTGDAPTFPQLIQRITPLQAAGKLDAAKLGELLGAVGLKSIADLVSASADARTNLAALLDTVQ